MMPRQPSVPNLICAAINLPWSKFAIYKAGLDQPLELLLVEVLDHFAHVLRMFARGDQQRIVGFDDDQVLHPHDCDELPLGVNEVPLRIQGKAPLGDDDIISVALAQVAMFIERRPGAKVVPSEVCLDAVNVRLVLALGGAGLEYGIIHADVFALGIKFGEGLLEAATSVTGRNFFQQRRRVRQMLTQRIGEGARTPNEHSAVPEEISRLDELLGDLGQRLLGEAPYLQCAFLRRLANFDVSVAGLRARGSNTYHDNVFAGGSDPGGPPNVVAKALLVHDHVIGGKHSDDCGGVAPLQQKGSQSNCWSGIPSHGLGNDLLLGKTLKLSHNGGTQVLVGDDPELSRLRQERQPFDGFLDHAFLAVQRQQLLGHPLAAQRPEASAASTGENDGIKRKLI